VCVCVCVCVCALCVCVCVCVRVRVMVAGTQLLSAIAIYNISAFYFSLAQPVMPIWTLLVGVAFGLERLNACKPAGAARLAGMALAVGGAVAAQALSAASPGAVVNATVGNVMLFFQTMLGGVYPLLQVKLLRRYSSLVVTAWGYLLGTGLIVLSSAPCMGAGISFNFSANAAYCVMYAILVNSSLNYFLMSWACARVGPVVRARHRACLLL
jgi:drug/metabolite transporter (DMT)-like permease